MESRRDFHSFSAEMNTDLFLKSYLTFSSLSSLEDNFLLFLLSPLHSKNPVGFQFPWWILLSLFLRFDITHPPSDLICPMGKHHQQPKFPFPLIFHLKNIFVKGYKCLLSNDICFPHFLERAKAHHSPCSHFHDQASVSLVLTHFCHLSCS